MQEATITEVYRAFNAHDIEAVIAHFTDDVDWPNAWEGGRLEGKEAVRAYWTRQFAEIDPRVEPRAIHETEDGRIRVEVEQRPRPEDDAVAVTHTYTFRGEKIARMEVG
jgi:hypothetical protein